MWASLETPRERIEEVHQVLSWPLFFTHNLLINALSDQDVGAAEQVLR